MLFRSGVRYHLIGGQSFFDRREIRDLLAYLKVFLNPRDEMSLLRIANVPARGLSEATMERLIHASQERKCSVFEVMKNPVVIAGFQSKTQENVAAFVKVIERTSGTLRNQALIGQSRPLGTWARAFLDEIGYFNELRRQEKNPEAAENRIRNLQELLDTMDDPEGESLPPLDRLETFLEEITLDNERETEEEGPGNAVTLITMHSCKGLEFPHVYIVGMEDGLLPHVRSKEENTQDEERRLFYVAITRAMQTLVISHCGGRKKYGKLIPAHPSPFLKELPEELVEYASEKAKIPVAPDSGKSLFAAMRAAVE